ncbi:MAG TPA: hypothetical protein VLK34_04335 [Nocardioidaceae bacterium]|nr:hypothetical protein [Nocardioidaceae bacterium]
MNDHDPFEERLRETLRSDDADDSGARPTDVDSFLSDVHRGARSRQRRRVAGAAVAAVLAVGGGGVAVASLGAFDGDNTPVADDTTNPTVDDTTESGATSPSTPTTSDTPTSRAPASLTYTSQNSDVLSLTSTDDNHQWALVRTKDGTCKDNSCATVFARGTGGTWSPLGVLPGPADNDTGYPDDVAQLRFAPDSRGGYDGWAFDNGLFSTHDGGTTWSRALPKQAGGQVHELEARGNTVYALITNGESHDDLVVSPMSSDDWQIVDTTMQLDFTNDLVVTEGVVAMIGNSGGDDHRVLSSAANPNTGLATGAWQFTDPCGSEQVAHLSSAANVLWALCTDGTVKTATVSGDGPPQWADAGGPYSPNALLAARSTTSAVLAQHNGLLELSADGTSKPLSDNGFSHASLLGFTNEQLGFALVDGILWRTEDGGTTWTTDDVIPPG